MLCIKCGHPHTNGASFCPQCGSAIVSSIGNPSSEPTRGARGPSDVPWRTLEVGVGIVLVAIAVLLAALLVSLAIKFGIRLEDPALVAWLTSISLGVVIFAIVWFLALKRYHLPLSALGLTPLGKPSPRAIVMTVGALMLSLGATALYAVLVRLSNLEILLPPEIPADIVFPGAGLVLTFLALAVWTPLSEEVFFRGFIFAGLSSRWGATGAMLISAAIFSVFHISPGVMIPIFITGLLLAGLYRQTGSLWACITAHAGQNAAALVVTMYGV